MTRRPIGVRAPCSTATALAGVGAAIALAGAAGPSAATAARPTQAAPTAGCRLRRTDRHPRL